MTAYGDGHRVPWALLSPEGTYYKLREPSFFVGRNGDVDLTLKVRLTSLNDMNEDLLVNVSI